MQAIERATARHLNGYFHWRTPALKAFVQYLAKLAVLNRLQNALFAGDRPLRNCSNCLDQASFLEIGQETSYIRLRLFRANRKPLRYEFAQLRFAAAFRKQNPQMRADAVERENGVEIAHAAANRDHHGFARHVARDKIGTANETGTRGRVV
jgi:hypothetical protein